MSTIQVKSDVKRAFRQAMSKAFEQVALNNGAFTGVRVILDRPEDIKQLPYIQVKVTFSKVEVLGLGAAYKQDVEGVTHVQQTYSLSGTVTFAHYAGTEPERDNLSDAVFDCLCPGDGQTNIFHDYLYNLVAGVSLIVDKSTVKLGGDSSESWGDGTQDQIYTDSVSAAFYGELVKSLGTTSRINSITFTPYIEGEQDPDPTW